MPKTAGTPLPTDRKPPPRTGPVPLGLHLAQALLASSARAAESPVPEAPDAMFSQTLAGIAAYHRHDFRRPPSESRTMLWEGTTHVEEFAGTGAPLLVVPSLVNPAYVLDLLPRRSFLKFLSKSGYRPLLVDWGSPGTLERGFGLADYVARLARFIQAAAAEAGRPMPVIGYCMGGTLALAAALRAPQAVERLALMAAPWHFHAADNASQQSLARAALPLIPLIESLGEAPVEIVQSFFAALDPASTARKFSRFARLDPDSEDARFFVALEDWANDGPPLAAPAAIEVLRDWYALDLPGTGAWRMEGELVRPTDLAAPLLLAVPKRDRIVSPQSAHALYGHRPDAAVLRPSSGHVGMVVGKRAEAELWRPLSDWLSAGV